MYRNRAPKDFLAVATPGAGKTTFALQIAAGLLSEGTVRQVTVVAPTEHPEDPMGRRRRARGRPNFSNSQGAHSDHYQGVAVTYAQIGMHPALHRARTEADRTLVILNEIHHAGDSRTWGDGVREAFDPAAAPGPDRHTPDSARTTQDPFVTTYEEDAEGFARSKADYTYGYGEERCARSVVRPVLFMTYSGRMHWRTKTGDEVSAQLGALETKDITQQAWRTALDPKGEWIPVRALGRGSALTEVRRHVPDAGGLVIATDQKSSGPTPRPSTTSPVRRPPWCSRTTRRRQRWIGSSPPPTTAGWSRCAWCPGVDVPRLSVGVYATSTSARCSSPRPWAASCARGPAARPRASSCPPSRS